MTYFYYGNMNKKLCFSQEHNIFSNPNSALTTRLWTQSMSRYTLAKDASIIDSILLFAFWPNITKSAKRVFSYFSFVNDAFIFQTNLMIIFPNCSYILLFMQYGNIFYSSCYVQDIRGQNVVNTQNFIFFFIYVQLMPYEISGLYFQTDLTSS